jgi:hypothetical protein
LINDDDIAGVMALDTWIRNSDGRQYRTRSAPEQPGKYEAIPIDQGHCFGSPGWTPQDLAADRTVAVPAPIKSVGAPIVRVFVKRLRTFDQLVAKSIMAEVPDEWITVDERAALGVYLSERAILAADALTNQYRMGGSGD